MIKADYKKELKHLYSAREGEPVVVVVPKLHFLMVDGKGDPNTSHDYSDAIQALYSVAYTIKFLCKNKYGQDFGVMPLESLWWTEDMATFSEANKNDWYWTAMIMQPESVTNEQFAEAVTQIRAKKALRLLDKIRFEVYDEGRAAQVLHVGSYASEGQTIRELHAFIAQQGGTLNAAKHHHEIYLSDPRRTDPSRLKTILRQPF